MVSEAAVSPQKLRRALWIVVPGLICIVVAVVALIGYRVLRTFGTVPAQQPDFDINSNGTTIVFAGAGNGEQDLYLLDLTSRHVTRICDTPEDELSPRFSPNGKRIVFAASMPDLSQPTHIFTCDLSGGNRVQVSRGKHFDLNPISLNADASKVAFARSALHRPYSYGGYINEDWDLWTTNAAGFEKQITHAKYDGIYSLDASRDGSTLLYPGAGTYPNNASHLWTIAANGSSPPKTIPLKDPKWSIAGPAYAVFAPTADTVDLMAGPSSDSLHYSWEIDSAKLGNKTVNRLTMVKGLITEIKADRVGKYIYYLVDPNYGSGYEKPEIWRLDLATKRNEFLVGNTLFTDPLAR